MAKKKRHPITGCRADTLMGVWFMDAGVFQPLLSQALSYDLMELVKMRNDLAWDDDSAEDPHRVYTMVGDTAIMEVSGPTTKYATSFQGVMGGTSTYEICKGLRKASNDPAVQKIILKFDTPGGTAAGTDEFVDRIRAVNKVKPVYAFASDCCASAGLLTASACRYIASNRIANIGSLGTMLVLRDMSGAFKKEGIVVHAVTSGKFKAVGTQGTKITDDQLSYIQKLVNDQNSHFVQTVKEGRGMTDEQVEKLAADAKLYYAPEALELGLIDEICSYEDFVDRIVQSTSPVTRSPKMPAKPKPAMTAGPSPVRSKPMFSAAQLQAIQKLPGGASATEENADQILFGLFSQQSEVLTATKTELETTKQHLAQAKTQIPATLPVAQAKGHLGLMQKELNLLVKSENVTPAQVEVLTKATQYDDATVSQRVLPDGTVLVPATALMSVLELNKPNGLRQQATGAQPVERQTPGKEDGDKKEEMTHARYNELRQQSGLSPVTEDEFKNRRKSA